MVKQKKVLPRFVIILLVLIILIIASFVGLFGSMIHQKIMCKKTPQEFYEYIEGHMQYNISQTTYCNLPFWMT
jgi:ABC-type transporter Mla maintaining outer membrane lipid asymmetry permease subunit MlaE